MNALGWIAAGLLVLIAFALARAAYYGVAGWLMMRESRKWGRKP